MPVSQTSTDSLAMIRCLICDVKSGDNISTAELLVSQKLGISVLGAAILSRCLRWFDHVNRGDSWTARVSAQDTDRRILRVRPRQTYEEVIKSDLQEYRLDASDTLGRIQWKSIVKSITMQHRNHLEVDSTT